MPEIFSDATVVIVSFSAGIYLSVMAVLAFKLVLEEPGVRRALFVPLMPVFLQNCGIPLAVVAFALHASDLALVAVLLIALGYVARGEEGASLHPTIEVPLLISAVIAFAAVCLLNLLTAIA